MHVVRSLLPQFLESSGYTVRPAPQDAVGGFVLFAEREGRTYGVFSKDGALSGADAVELRLLALANDVIPLVVAPDGLAGEGARWIERFGIEVLGPMEVFAFEAKVEAEEMLLADERAWALEHPIVVAAPAPPVALPSEVPVEIPLALRLAPPILLLAPPTIPPAFDPYRVDSFLVLRRADLIENVRHRTELAAEALAALPFPESSFVEHVAWAPLVDWAPDALLALPPAELPASAFAPRFDPYGFEGLWVEAANERLLADAASAELAAEALAALPWPALPEVAEIPLLEIVVEAPPAVEAIAAELPWHEDAPAAPEPAVADLPWSAPAEAVAAAVAEPPAAEAAPVAPELPWSAPAEAVVAPAPEPVAAGLPWEETAAPDPAPVDARLPWDVAEAQVEPVDPRAELLRAHRGATFATASLGRLLPSPTHDNLVARADPSVWGTRGRLDDIRQRLNARNVALSVEGVESDWLRGIVEEPARDE